MRGKPLTQMEAIKAIMQTLERVPEHQDRQQAIRKVATLFDVGTKEPQEGRREPQA